MLLGCRTILAWLTFDRDGELLHLTRPLVMATSVPTSRRRDAISLLHPSESPSVSTRATSLVASLASLPR
jgi:hypothetical protein